MNIVPRKHRLEEQNHLRALSENSEEGGEAKCPRIVAGRRLFCLGLNLGGPCFCFRLGEHPVADIIENEDCGQRRNSFDHFLRGGIGKSEKI